MKAKLRSKITLYVLAFFVLVWSLFPIYWIVISSLRGFDRFFKDSTKLVPTEIDLQFFHNILGETNYGIYYKNSIVVALATSLITIILATLMSYVLTRYKFTGKSMLLNLMLIGYMLPQMLLAIPLLGLFIALGIDDTIPALIISHISITLPFGVWMLVNFFRTIPVELEESSWVDGASRLQSIIRVIFPLILPGVISVGVFSFIVSFTDYTFGLMIVSSEENKTIPVGLATIKESTSLHRGELLAGAALIAVPMIVLFSFVTRYFIKGLTAGAVKG